jgi:endoglucanase
MEGAAYTVARAHTRQTLMSRRAFISRTVAVGLGAGLLSSGCGPVRFGFERKLPEATAKTLPAWRGFNLLEKFTDENRRFNEEDFEWIAELGFNFVRLPMNYRLWIEGNDWMRLREETFGEIDEAVRFGEKYKIHVCLNFHRAPGYSVALPPERKSIWNDDEALRVCALHWATFAERYHGIPNRLLSFNLLNEPGRIAPHTHRRVVSHLVEAIRRHDSHRLIICDGREWGNMAPTELVGLGTAAATRGYQPLRISHYRAAWIDGATQWPEPRWPLRVGDTLWNKETLRERQVEPWQKLEAAGVGVMVGEFGAFNQTAHKVVLEWMRDYLDLWQEAGWGFAMWDFRGPFGIIDNGRRDVDYEVWRGRRLDRTMLNLLKEYM